jgi:hypothetical protein
MTDVSDNVVDNVTEVKKPTTVLLSKKKYQEIKIRLNNLFDEDTVDKMLREMTEVLHFDPEVGLYNKERGKKMVEYRNKKAAEEGLTLHQWRKIHKKDKSKTT